VLLVWDEKEDKTVRKLEIIILISVSLAVFFGAMTVTNSCYFAGHIPMADCPQDFTVVMTGDTSVQWSGVVNICGRKFHVCRRCGLVYLERAEVEAGKKP
jgi:hypothetical protein